MFGLVCGARTDSSSISSRTMADGAYTTSRALLVHDLETSDGLLPDLVVLHTFCVP